jgi:hypothetical protein
MTRKLNPPAASGERASSPTAAASQEMARMNSSRTPAAASQSGGPALGRNPIRKATPNTSTVEARLRTTLAATCPARTDAPATSMDRNRSMTPPVMSLVTPTAVIEAPNPAHSSSTPGTT